MKSGANYKITRRTFFKTVAFLGVLSAAVTSCKEKVISFYFRKTMTNYNLGHRLWLKDFPAVTEVSHIKYVIIGGGISGLSAARQFVKKGIQDFMMLELEDHLGGNSSNGENQYSKYPLGAHYLPIPNKEDKELLQFLEEENIIRIRTVIMVERDSQKGIIIGHKGAALKKVGMQAREDLEKFFGKKIHIETYVKVNKDWRSSEYQLRRFGYSQK